MKNQLEMKVSILSFVLILTANLSFAQSFCEASFPRYIKLEGCTPVLGVEVYAFNELAKHLELKDTIKYECLEGAIGFSYKGEALEDWKYDPQMCGKKFMLKMGQYSSSFSLLASIPTSGGKAQIYEAIRPNKGKKGVSIKIYKEDGVLPYGDYVEKTCSGKVLVKGQYQLTDSPSTYAYSRYDSELKKHVDERVDQDQTSSRAGVWQFFDDNGALLYEEDYASGGFTSSAPVSDLCSDIERDVKYNGYTIETKISPAIAIFNAVYSKMGRAPQLTYEVTQRGVNYYFRGKAIPSPFFDMQGRYKQWDHQMANHNGPLLLEYSRGNALRAYIPGADGKGELIRFEKKVFSRIKTLDVFQTQDEQPNGAFERRTCEGKLLIAGNYKTIDTVYTLREKKLNQETYAQEWVETTYNALTARSGQWKYYDDNEEITLEENYPGQQKWNKSSIFLCTTNRKEVKAMTENLKNPYMIFNSMCALAGLDYWLSVDDILERKMHYYNGKWTSEPEDVSKQNYTGDFKFETTDGTINIYANTRTRSAVGGSSKERKLNYYVNFEFPENKKLLLNYSRAKLTKQERLNGQNIGMFEERQCDGRILLQGQYCQVDEVFRDTIVTFDPETYEETVTITEYDKRAKKYGVWKHYDVNGVLVKEEDLGPCEK